MQFRVVCNRYSDVLDFSYVLIYMRCELAQLLEIYGLTEYDDWLYDWLETIPLVLNSQSFKMRALIF